MANEMFIRGSLDWPDLDNTNFRWMLLDDNAAPDCTTDEFVADVSADELTDPSYGRVTLTGSAITYDVAECSVFFDASNPTFAALAGGENVKWLVLFRQVTNDADSRLMMAYEMAYTTDGSDFTPKINSRGLAVLQFTPCEVVTTVF